MLKQINSNRQIKTGAVMSYVTIGFNIIAGLIYTPWMVRQIGQSDYGLYTLAVSLISFFAMDFGLGSAVSRFLSKYKATNDIQGERRFLGITFKLFTLIAIIIFLALVIVYFFIENIYIELTPLEIEKLKILYVITGFFTVVSFPFKPFDGILIANERFAFIKFVDLLQKITIIFLLVSALLLGFGLYAIVIVNALVGIIAIIIKYMYITKNTDTDMELDYQDKGLYSEIFKFSLWTTVILVAQRFILNITPTILGAFSGSSEIAVFSVGMTIEGYTFTLAHAFGGMFLPKVTKMIANNDDKILEVENLLIKVGRIQFLIIGLIIAGIVSMGYEFMLLWMGPSFKNSYLVALFLIAPGIITLTQEIANTALIAKNEIRYRAISSLMVATISIILSIILSQKYGALGSAFSIFIANVIGLVIFMNYVYYKILKINVFRFFKECHFKMIFPFLTTIIIGLCIQYFVPVHALFLFMIKAGVLALIYILLMWIFALNKFEKQLFIDLFKSILKRR